MEKKPKIQNVTAIVRAPAPSPGAIERRSLRPALEQKLKEKLNQYVHDSIAPNTHKAYESDARLFREWCEEMGYSWLPADPGTVALYITALSTGDTDGEKKKYSTISRALAGIAMKHRQAGLPSPVTDDVKTALQGLRRNVNTKQTQKKPLLDEEIARIVATMQDDPQGLRDAALIMIGQHAALRRDEIHRMDRSWLTIGEYGLEIEIPYSKASQTEPEYVFVPRAETEPCAVASLERWLEWSETAFDGPHVFCQFDRQRRPLVAERISGYGIARIIKRLVRDNDIGDPAEYSGHSLRRGFVTQQHREGTPLSVIMETTRHKTYNTVLCYIEKLKARDRIGKVVRNWKAKP